MKGVGGAESGQEQVLLAKSVEMFDVGSLEVVIDNLLSREFVLTLSERGQPEWVFELFPCHWLDRWSLAPR